MSYTAYVRAEGRGVIDLDITATLRFDTMHAITRNRIKEAVTTGYCPYNTWGTKAGGAIKVICPSLRVYSSLTHRDIMQSMSPDEMEFLNAELLIKTKFKVDCISPGFWSRFMLKYKFPYSWITNNEDEYNTDRRRAQTILKTHCLPHINELWTLRELRDRNTLLACIHDKKPLALKAPEHR